MDRIQRLLIEGLQACDPFMKGKSTKEELLFLACGGRTASPFPAKIVEETRDQIRLPLLDKGLETGLPRESDVPSL